MAITKANTAISAGTWQSGSVTASGTSLAVATTGDYADCLYVSIANSSSAPSVGATFYVQQSPDGSAWYSGPTFTAGLTEPYTYAWQIPLDPTCEKVQVVWATGTGGVQTIAIQLGQVTAV